MVRRHSRLLLDHFFIKTTLLVKQIAKVLMPLCKTLDGPFVSSPSSFLTALDMHGLYNQHEAAATV